MKPHKHAALIHAWADGAIIQYRLDRDSDWHSVEKPDWLDNVEYRVKPAPEQFFFRLDRDGTDLMPRSIQLSDPRFADNTVAVVTLNIDPDTFEVTATTEKL